MYTKLSQTAKKVFQARSEQLYVSHSHGSLLIDFFRVRKQSSFYKAGMLWGFFFLVRKANFKFVYKLDTMHEMLTCD